MYQKFYSAFLKNHSHLQHYAAHSHHFWPDVTKQAVLEYWDLASVCSDRKWSTIFTEKVPEVQKRIAARLSLHKPENICFAPNTHDLIIRLLSSLDFKKNKIRILTTDSEFHSFKRQISILQHHKMIELKIIPTKPYHNLSERIITELEKGQYDLLFASHVFFNSGIVLENIEEIAHTAEEQNTLFALDGYHSFMAIPIDLDHIQNKVFFIAGSYKYAQAGEGCCFMTVPEQADLRNPIISGWFADFENLDSPDQTIFYSQNGYRFAGSTMDYSALYKLNAVLKLFDEHHISEIEIHGYVQKLQKNFLQELEKINHPELNEKKLICHDLSYHGHFYAFDFKDIHLCRKMVEHLENNNIITDSRGSILRFGFGLYQNEKINLSEI
jgi:selenocysteine lyase/cysteine desulfurase